MVDLEGKHVVLAYSGGLDTSVILHWLIQRGAKVTAFMADVGQGKETEPLADDVGGGEMGPALEKAHALGASDVRVVDVRREFVQDYVFPAIRGNLRYEGQYLLGTSLARPATADAHVRVARELAGDAGDASVILSHGATEKGNDQIRFELAWKVLMPQAGIYAPWKDPDFSQQFKGGRRAMLAYAAEHSIPVAQTSDKPWSSDANLAHISYEGGILEDPNTVPPDTMFRLTKSPQQAPDVETIVEITFERGNAIQIKQITGQSVDTFAYLGGIERQRPVEVLTFLNYLAGQNGVGRIDIVESRATGMKSRGVYEAPGVTVLMFAHELLEQLTLDREVIRRNRQASLDLADVVYRGLWFSPEAEYLQMQIDASQEYVTGTVHVGLYRGNMAMRGRTSPHSLYKGNLASMDEAGTFDPTTARGFIDMTALRLQGQADRLVGR